MLRKSTYFAFFATASIVVLLHVSMPYTGIARVVLNELFIWGFLGLVVINILLFVIPLCYGLRNLKKNAAKKQKSELENQKDEKTVERLLQGDSIVNKMPAWARTGVNICIGLIVGSIVGFLLNKIIAP